MTHATNVQPTSVFSIPMARICRWPLDHRADRRDEVQAEDDENRHSQPDDAHPRGDRALNHFDAVGEDDEGYASGGQQREHPGEIRPSWAPEVRAFWGLS